jgi:hypothetical protein
MTFLDELKATASAAPNRERCTIARILDREDEEFRRDLLYAFEARDEFTGAAIKRALVARGYHIGEITVNRHRRGECSC